MGNLQDYYNSPAWAAKRNERLKMDGYRCARCGFTRSLQIHHLNYDRLYNEDVSRDLVTLCKRCHKEIEMQKKAVNPVPVEHHSVYLAGKISQCDWRPYDLGMIPEDFTSEPYKVSENLTITGPFFLKCDHGCYHGDDSHGVGARDGGCMGHYYSQDDVFNICKAQIDAAEIVFAYINAWNCFGTIAEIGYAHAKGKDIRILFHNKAVKDAMWFVDKMQRDTGIVSQEWLEEQIISKIRRIDYGITKV